VTTAVVFAYHDVGCRCLKVLLDQRIQVPLVITHRDDPADNRLVRQRRELARARSIETLVPDDPNTPELAGKVRDLRPDFLFSFYYRLMLKPALLSASRRGAFKHARLAPSEVPRRAPVNWAIIHGETETGATLHEMVEKPDAGRIVDQEAVGIGPTSSRWTCSERSRVLPSAFSRRSLPKLIDGSAVLRAQDLSRGGYFGGRRPRTAASTGGAPAKRVHDLVRAVAPPYPGAFTEVEGMRLRVLRDAKGREEERRAGCRVPPRRRRPLLCGLRRRRACGAPRAGAGRTAALLRARLANRIGDRTLPLH